MALDLAEVLRGLPLRDQAFPYLLQYDQPVAVLLCSGMYSCIHLSRPEPAIWHRHANRGPCPANHKAVMLKRYSGRDWLKDA